MTVSIILLWRVAVVPPFPRSFTGNSFEVLSSEVCHRALQYQWRTLTYAKDSNLWCIIWIQWWSFWNSFLHPQQTCCSRSTSNCKHFLTIRGHLSSLLIMRGWRCWFVFESYLAQVLHMPSDDENFSETQLYLHQGLGDIILARVVRQKKCFLAIEMRNRLYTFQCSLWKCPNLFIPPDTL